MLRVVYFSDLGHSCWSMSRSNHFRQKLTLSSWTCSLLVFHQIDELSISHKRLIVVVASLISNHCHCCCFWRCRFLSLSSRLFVLITSNLTRGQQQKEQEKRVTSSKRTGEVTSAVSVPPLHALDFTAVGGRYRDHSNQAARRLFRFSSCILLLSFIIVVFGFFFGFDTTPSSAFCRINEKVFVCLYVRTLESVF